MAKSKGYGGLIFLVIVVLAAAGGAGYYFYGKGDKQPEYSTVKVTRGNIVQSISATGNLQTTSQVTVSSQVSGNVIDINADFNDNVKKGQWLLKIDESTYQQKLKQAQADFTAAEANTEKVRGDTARTKELFEKNLVSKSEYDTAVAQLAQSESTLVSRQAALENAKTDLARCIIYSPIDGVVLNRTIDKGATVNVNQTAVALYTIINDLSKLQISADVSEADIGNVKEDQVAYFTVDAYLNQRFQGTVSQVRNYAKNTSGVVTFSVIIDVDNSNHLLKPGMTATANIVVAERPNVLMVTNNALRVRPPQELLDKAAKRIGTPAPASTPAAAPAPAAATAPAGVAQDEGAPGAGQEGRRGRGGRGGGGGRGRGMGTGTTTGVGMNVSNAPRTLYKLVTDSSGQKWPEAVVAHLGISDGTSTQILDGVEEGDTLITYVTMPGAAAAAAGPAAQTGNPFQQNQRGGGFGGPGGFGGGRGF
jgi:HlyD family secretion protein